MSNPEFILRKMSRKGDESAAVTFPVLQAQLTRHLGMNGAAVRADAGEMLFIGHEYPKVIEHIDGLVQQEARQVEVLLLPRVTGG